MKITSWSYGCNNLFKLGSLYLYEEPWQLALCGWFVDRIVGKFCCLFHWAKLPNIKMPKWWFRNDKDWEDYDGTFRDYYGDIGQIWHCEVYNPLFQKYWNARQKYEVTIELGYDIIKNKFYSRDSEYFDNMEKDYLEDADEKN